MNWRAFPQPQDACRTAVQELIQIAKKTANETGAVRIALPTGSTMIPFYAELSQQLQGTNLKGWRFFPVDEYIGLSGTDPRTFKNFLDEKFFRNIPNTNYLRFTWQKNREDIIEELKESPLDIIVLGVGLNGHIAFNEPGSTIDSKIREVTLSETTLKKNFGEPLPEDAPKTAITLGIQEIHATKNIFVLAFGEAKSKIINAIHAIDANPEFPATLIKNHPGSKWLYDKDAASELQHT